MDTSEWFEGMKIFGLIVAVWFALVGWRLLPITRKSNDDDETKAAERFVK